MRGLDEADERVLVDEARRGEADAFAELYRRHLDGVFGFCWRRTRDRQAAEDVTAATFERALRALPRFEWRDGGFTPWLYRIAANQLADHHRAERRKAALLPMPVGLPADPMDEAIRADDDRNLLAAISALRPRYQEVVSLRYLAGLSADETAAALGLPKPAVAVTLHRALRALRRELEREGG